MGNLPRSHEYVEEDRGYVTPCWIWQGSLKATGYGKKWLWPGTDPRGRKFALAHRYFYEEVYGPIPDNHALHHRCEVRACCRPSHCIPVPTEKHAREHATRLSPEEKASIVHLYTSTKLLTKEIAQRFGVCQAYVSEIANKAGARRQKK